MACLLVQINDHHARKPPGWLITALPINYQFTGDAQSHRLNARVICPSLAPEDIEALFAPDVPEELRTANKETKQILDDLIAKDRDNKVAIMAALEVHNTAISAVVHAVAERPRKFMLDHVSLIPKSIRQDVIATWTKRNEIAVAARTEARARVDAVLERRLQRKLTPTEKLMKTSDFTKALATYWEIAQDAGADKATLGKIDEAIREIKAASKAGSDSIEGPAFDLLAVPDAHEVSRVDLDAATVEVPK